MQVIIRSIDKNSHLIFILFFTFFVKYLFYITPTFSHLQKMSDAYGSLPLLKRHISTYPIL